MTFKISPSSLNLMEECARCFWLEKHEVWKRPSGIFPSLPSGMDKILKIHFDKYMKLGKLPPKLCESGECQETKLFDNEELLNVWRNARRGIIFQDDKGNILQGAVDNLLVKNDKLIVLDYKTRGFPLKEDTAGKYQNQLDIYNFLLRANGYETEDYAFLLFYVPKEVLPKGEVLFDTTLVKMKINVENAKKLFEKALELLNGPCPEQHCEWCEKIESY